MRVCVTGGAGFIGSHVVDRFVGEGAEVLVVDDFSAGRPENLEAVAGRLAGVEKADVAEERAAEVIQRFAPDVVVHMAAQPSVVVSTADPGLDARINVLGTVNVLQACVAAGARKFVFAASSGTLYGEPNEADLPMSETDPWDPISPYGISKRVGIDYARFFSSVHGLATTSLALANVYGPRQDPHGEAGVVAIWGRRLLAGEACSIFGDGEQTRDFVYAGDVARAFVLAADRADGAVINIGTQTRISVRELYEVMAGLVGTDAAAVSEDARPGELRHISVDITRARDLLGWEPTVGLEQGLAETLAWMRSA